MPFTMTTGFLFDALSVGLAPFAAGVYGLYTTAQWVYVGESEDIRRRLTEHLNSDNPCITLAQPTHHIYELVSGGQQARRQREAQLIAELSPTCN